MLATRIKSLPKFLLMVKPPNRPRLRVHSVILDLDRNIATSNLYVARSPLNDLELTLRQNLIKKPITINEVEYESETAQLTKSDIDELITKHPQLHFIEAKTWKRLTNILTSNGFKINEVKEMIYKEHKIMELKMDDTIQNTLTVLRGLGLGEKNVLKLLHEHPILFLLKPNSLSLRYEQLDGCFPRKDICKIIRETPAVLYEDWGNIMRKIQYIIFKMGLEQDDIVKSKALQYPIEFIKLRHQLLERSGFYLKPTPKTKAMSKNLPLKDILTKSDKQISKYCKVSSQEYYVLSNILEVEKDPDEYYDSDIESDLETL